MFIAWIQKYIIFILIGLIIAASLWGGWQYTRVLSQKTTIANAEASILQLKTTQEGMKTLITSYEKQAEIVKKVQQAQQVISNNSAVITAQIDNLKTKCVLEVDDEKIINNMCDYFNSHGVLQLVPKADSSPTPSSKSLR